MIGRTNAGGMNIINFKVVGNPQPENPKQNTLWVDTDVEITGWDFNAIQPENPIEGSLWVITGSSSGVEFNALKKNSVAVYPIAVKQYIGGAWVDKNAKTYQNGEWVTWWNGELYDYGNEYVDITGGWKGATVSTQYNASGGTFTKNEDNIYFRNVASGSFSAVTINKIDLTGWKTLHLTKKCAYEMSIALFDSYPKSSPLAFQSIGGSSGIVEVSMDISSINQPVYVTFGDSMPSGVNIYKVRLER